MLWSDERIAELVDRLIAGGQRAFATEALNEMRTEYEKHMAAKDAYIHQQQAHIAALTEALNDSRQRDIARF